MQDKIQKYQQACEEVEKQKRELTNELAGHLPDLFKDIFDKYPQMENFSWTQYTQSFNDGDPCYFAVYNDVYSMKYNGNSLDDGIEEWEDNTQTEDEIIKQLDECGDVINMLGEDLLLKMFDDGVKITVYRDKVETEEYYD